jgi:hypothetical protein
VTRGFICSRNLFGEEKKKEEKTKEEEKREEIRDI